MESPRGRHVRVSQADRGGMNLARFNGALTKSANSLTFRLVLFGVLGEVPSDRFGSPKVAVFKLEKPDTRKARR